MFFIFLLCSAKCVYFYTPIYLPVVTDGCRSSRHHLEQPSEGVGKRKLPLTYAFLTAKKQFPGAT